MILLNIIVTLGLTIIWSENPSVECFSVNNVNGCYRSDKVIVLGYKNSDKVLYHELGHALFREDEEVKELVKTLPDLKTYSNSYNTEEKQLNEKVADYFAKYNGKFGDELESQELIELFDKRLKQYSSF